MDTKLFRADENENYISDTIIFNDKFSRKSKIDRIF